MADTNDRAEMTHQLRLWVRQRFGVWITWRTASSAITFITECDKDGNKREQSNG